MGQVDTAGVKTERQDLVAVLARQLDRNAGLPVVQRDKVAAIAPSRQMRTDGSSGAGSRHRLTFSGGRGAGSHVAQGVAH